MGSLLSRAAGPRAQGAVQGGGQAIQSLAMMIAPLWSGWIFSRFGPATPFWSGAIWIGLAILAILLANPVLRAALATTGEQPGEA
jgi:DHA1 family tetracycline resistance protein-like MFS transporter